MESPRYFSIYSIRTVRLHNKYALHTLYFCFKPACIKFNSGEPERTSITLTSSTVSLSVHIGYSPGRTVARI